MKHFLTMLILLAALGGRAGAGDVSADFDGANKLYAQGKFAEAAAEYQKLVQVGTVNSTVYFNLGNAQFKAGQFGRAIAAYRHAARLSPRDPDVQANLRFARNQVSAADAPRLSLLQRALGRLTLNEWTWLATAAVGGFFILLAVREWRPALRRSFRGLTFSAGLAALALVGCTGATWAVNHSTRAAVVVANDTPVKAGPLEDSQTAFTARDGVEFNVLDAREEWLQVTDSRQRIGWVSRNRVELLGD